MIIGGRSLDQLYKSSIDDADTPNTDIKLQESFNNNDIEDLKMQLLKAEKERQYTIDECNR